MNGQTKEDEKASPVSRRQPFVLQGRCRIPFAQCKRQLGLHVDAMSTEQPARRASADVLAKEKVSGSSPHASPVPLKALSMPTLDDQIRNILEAESPREDGDASTSSSEGMKPTDIERPVSPGVASDSIAQGRSLSRKRASIRLEFSMSDDNIEAEPGSDASWVVEQQNCA